MHKRQTSKKLALKSIKAGKPTLIVAAPGSNIGELAENISKELNLPLLSLDIHALHDAKGTEEITGPENKDHQIKGKKPGWFPSRPTLMLIDRVNNADFKETEFACEMVIQSSFNEMKLPEGSVVIATVVPENITDIQIPEELLKTCRIVTLPADKKEEK